MAIFANLIDRFAYFANASHVIFIISYLFLKNYAHFDIYFSVIDYMSKI